MDFLLYEYVNVVYSCACVRVCFCARARARFHVRVHVSYVYMYINILQFYGVAGKEDRNQTVLIN